MTSTPSINTIQSVAEKLKNKIVHTPTIPYPGVPIDGLEASELLVKLELLQHAGSFKARGALNNIMSMPDDKTGVTAFSAGNHAIAVSYAAYQAGVSAKVVMPRTANPFRVERCQYWGAEVEFGETIADLLAIVEDLQATENRMLVHPFEGERTVEGTATVGLELCNDVKDLDVVIVPVGGGGLIGGIASAIKQLQPNCRVIGVEPSEAKGMADSIRNGAPLDTVKLNSIADSLSAPMHLPLTFSLVQEHVDELVQVSDDEIRSAMRLMFSELKLAVEPACASALAALRGPLLNSVAGKRVALIACGSNIDFQTYSKLLA